MTSAEASDHRTAATLHAGRVLLSFGLRFSKIEPLPGRCRVTLLDGTVHDLPLTRDTGELVDAVRRLPRP